MELTSTTITAHGRDPKKVLRCAVLRSRKECQCSTKQEGSTRALTDDVAQLLCGDTYAPRTLLNPTFYKAG